MPYFLKTAKATIATMITSTVTIDIITMIDSTMARVGLPVVEIGPKIMEMIIRLSRAIYIDYLPSVDDTPIAHEFKLLVIVFDSRQLVGLRSIITVCMGENRKFRNYAAMALLSHLIVIVLAV